MNKELIIEHYLSQLDRELQALPTGQRAEIITEIRSHILEASERDPAKSVQSILDGMGAPREVAAKYLQQKGVKGWTPSPARNFLKYFALGVAGLFALAIFSTVFMIWYFSPLIEVDEAKGRVRILGGVIDVNEMTETVKIGGMTMKGSIDGSNVEINGVGSEDPVEEYETGTGKFTLNLNGGNRSAGIEELAGRNITALRIPFNTAKLEIRPSRDSRFRWECKNMTAKPPPITIAAGTMTFDLEQVKMAKCELKLPEGVKAEIKGVNGSLELHKPAGAYDIKVTNGKVDIKPDSSRVYDFEVKVINGMHDEFQRSADKQALKVKVDMINGVIHKE